MLLRSSSTPVLGSLILSSFSETTPNNNPSSSSCSSPFHCNKPLISFATSSSNFHSCNSSPSINGDFTDTHNHFSSKGSFRRAQSEGNLNNLIINTHFSDEHHHHHHNRSFISADSHKPKHPKLETIHSFSFCNSTGKTLDLEEEDSDFEEDWSEKEEDDDDDDRCRAAMAEIGVKTWSGNKMGIQEESGFINQEMYLAKGLGIDSDGFRGGFGNGGYGGGGGGREFSSGDYGGEGGGESGMEEYYKRMMVENPGNPLILRNYAHFLYQCKGDLRGAEEYYSRAILIDSNDGEVLSQYAKLVWELHHDLQTSSNYFQLALQASPQDSHVHAAYANFLWETEEGEGEDAQGMVSMPPFGQSHPPAAAPTPA